MVLDYYGRYEVPAKIKQLYKLEMELVADGLSLDFQMGIIMTKGEIRYMSTPPDVIPFATAGVDGIHFGFVTDFGTASDLEDAYITAVFPMDFGSEIQLVARNLDDFLAMVYTDNSILYNPFSELEHFAHYLQNREVHPLDEEVLRTRERYRNFFGITPIADMVQYLADLRKQRTDNCVIHTLNQLGVTRYGPGPRSVPISPFPLTKDSRWDEIKHAVHSYFSMAPMEAKLAFLRDAQTTNLLDDRDARNWAKNQLISYGLEEEASRLESSYFVDESLYSAPPPAAEVSILYWSDSIDPIPTKEE